ncbi:SctK family type III secretion system sorting platform protein [Mesorhizobium sp. 1M-11]|uniref:SctK family type III secretion system sorting platform protein n=1 Tax=Mesorhizobium sp. 1M-11 TaxID=1529006 RepID=UPI0006C73ACA|nr:SctK family type III secretion system sorting platform protein [Mesorhizobium sp. 1M-11]
MTQLAGQEEAVHSDWQEFWSNPAGYADAGWLSDCFDGKVGFEACERMLETPRLQPRLSKLLAERHELTTDDPPQPPDHIDRQIALVSGEDLERLALRAGAIYWANSLAAVIDGRQAGAIQTALGPELCAFAVANRDISGPVRPLEPLDGLSGRIFADGLNCLESWLQDMPPQLGKRVRLRLANGLPGLGDATQVAELGARILRRAME